jgi:putative hydrolase of the HAD superfamily
MRTRPRWVAFDAVGTLLVPEPSVPMVYHAAGQRHGSQLDLTAVAEGFSRVYRQRSNPELLDRLQTSEDNERTWWQRVVREVFPDVADPVALHADLHDYFARPDVWRLCDDGAAAIESLRERGIQIALASNFDARLHAIGAGHPGLESIEVRVVSSEVGWRKPAREFYTALALACRARPDEILMVGDDRDCDYRGAREAGFSALLIHRRATSPSEDCLTSLNELVDRIA